MSDEYLYTGTVNVRASRNSTFDVAVRVVQERRNFGRTDLLVRPINGFGEAWVSEERFIRDEE